MTTDKEVMIFEEARPMLMGLAYRMLGSAMEAEDAVQDTYLRWQKADRDSVDNPKSWLAVVCIRRCIDLSNLARNKRVTYVGEWLPEPIYTEKVDTPEEQVSFAWSLTTAFLLLLERLTPKERAAYLMYEIFGYSYTDIAETLHIQEVTCRKLVSRARDHIHLERIRHQTPPDRQETFLNAFQTAIGSGEMGALISLLSDEIELSADSDGKVAAVREILHGKRKVLEFLEQTLGPAWRNCTHEIAEINGSLGMLVFENRQITASVSFGYNEQNEVTHVYIMRNPDKLNRLQQIHQSKRETGN